MPAPTTTVNLVEFIKKSGLMEPARLTDYLRNIPDAAGFPPADLARRMVQDGVITHFQAKHLLKGRYRNFFIGKFKVLEPLGSGGMSQVYLCEHAVMKHRVAMKLLPARGGEDPAAVGRFLREARAAAAVNHPNVVRSHDFDLAEGKFYYLIMEYVDGINLHDLVKKLGPLAPEYAVNYIAQATAGLQHICECGLIHRDIKPSNLLVDHAGVVRILDLGLARFTNDDKDNLTRQLQGKSILGTADFLAPEQALQADKIDIRADIYSLGATLYFLLSGRAPFEQQSVTQKLLAHQLRDPDPLTGIPPELAEVVAKMMKKAPADRYQLPSDVLEALVPWTSTPPPLPDPSWFPGRVGAPAPGTGPIGPNPPAGLSSIGRTPPPASSGRMGPLSLSRDSTILPPKSNPTRPPMPAAVPTATGSGPVPAMKSNRNLWIVLGILVAMIFFGGIALALTRI